MVDSKIGNRPVSLNEFAASMSDELTVRKNVTKFLFKMWENEKSVDQNELATLESAKLPLDIALLETRHLIRTHGLMSFLTSLGLPDPLWQAGYCLWLKTDSAIRSYIGAKEELATELANWPSGAKLTGHAVDILHNMKNAANELFSLDVLPEDIDFIDIMRTFKEFCPADTLAILIDKELEIERYGELRQELMQTFKEESSELSADQIELIDELILSQKALEASGLALNKSRDIGELVSHLKHTSPLISSLKSHLAKAHNIEEIELKSSDFVEEQNSHVAKISYSFLGLFENGRFNNEEKRDKKLLRMIAAMAIFGLLSLGVALAMHESQNSTSFNLATAQNLAAAEAEESDFSVEIDLDNLKVLAYSEEED